MSHPETWRVDPVKLLREECDTILPTVGLGDVLRFSIDHGRIEFFHQAAGYGSLESSYVLHPGDGLCHAQPSVVDGSDGVCVHCGRTLFP